MTISDCLMTVSNDGEAARRCAEPDRYNGRQFRLECTMLIPRCDDGGTGQESRGRGPACLAYQRPMVIPLCVPAAYVRVLAAHVRVSAARDRVRLYGLCHVRC